MLSVAVRLSGQLHPQPRMHESYLYSASTQPLIRDMEGGKRGGRRTKSLELSRYEVFMRQSTKSRMCAGVGILERREGDRDPLTLSLRRENQFWTTRLYYLLISVRSPPLPPLLEGCRTPKSSSLLITPVGLTSGKALHVEIASRGNALLP